MFSVSSWWGWAGWPTPEDFESLWVLLTLVVAAVAALLALLQLRSNANVSREQSRPFVVVDFKFRSILIVIEVQNSGKTAAHNVTFDWSNIPVAMNEDKKKAIQRALVDEGLPFLAPGRVIQFMLHRFPDYPDEPRQFRVNAKYRGPDNRRWESISVLDLDMWSQALAEQDYDNKNWNENQRQTKAQQETAKQVGKVADSVGVFAEFLEQTPAMRRARAQEEADIEAQIRGEYEASVAEKQRLLESDSEH
jgi:hypothetical protein